MEYLLQKHAFAALNGFMQCHPLLHNYHCIYDNYILPEPSNKCHPNNKDCTAEALEAWLAIRELTGDYKTGLDIQKKQEQLLFSKVNPETGLVYSPEKSNPRKNQYYYHLRDQIQTLRYFVKAFVLNDNKIDKTRYKKCIDKMISEIVKLAQKEYHPEFGDILFFSHDIFIGTQSVNEPVICEVPRIGQLIDPMVTYCDSVNDNSTEETLQEVVGGALSGYENINNSNNNPRLTFADNGAFFGHFLSHTSTLIGIAKYAKFLWKKGKYPLSVKYLKLCRKCYDWIYDTKNNIHAGSSYGWFPQKTDNPQNSDVLAETCCTANMIELGVELASAAVLAEEFSSWTNIWDDVDRCLRNSLTKAQLILTPAITKKISEIGNWKECQEVNLLKQFDGVWVSDFLPNDFITTSSNIYPDQPSLRVKACCMYSGPRALSVFYKSCCKVEKKETTVNLSHSYENDFMKIVADNLGKTLLITNKSTDSIKVRIPNWAKQEPPIIERENSKHRIIAINDTHFIRFDNLPSHSSLKIRFCGQPYTRIEKIGGINRYTNGMRDSDKRIEYTSQYTGNTLTQLIPHGTYLPFEIGLNE